MARRESLLPEGACVVSVMHMVNPSTFWVSEPPGHDMTEERVELQDMEEKLQAHCRHTSFYNQTPYMPEQGEMIAVEHPETHRWLRAKVETVLNMTSGFIYKVFLVDHGMPLQVRNSSIQELPTVFESLSYQAMQIMLHGVVPVTRQVEYEYTITKTTVLDHWTTAAVRFAKKTLDESLKAYVVYHKRTKHVIYGDLYLELENGIVSLKDLLCENEYAIFDVELFEQGCEETVTSGKPFVMLSSSDGNSSCGRSSSRSPKHDSVKSEHRSIRDYLNEYNERKKLKAKDTMSRIEQWRQQSETFEQSKENNGEDEPLGRGIPVRGRRQVTPGGVAQKQQNNNYSSSVEQSSDMGLLNLLDMMTKVEEVPQKDLSEASISHLKSTQVKASEANRSISYMPAGSHVGCTSKRKTNATHSSHHKLEFNRNMTSSSQRNVNKNRSEQLKGTKCYTLASNAKSFNSNSYENRSHNISVSDKKITENGFNSKMLPELPELNTTKTKSEDVRQTMDHKDNNKEDKSHFISSQDSELCVGINKVTESLSDNKKLPYDCSKLSEIPKEQKSQETSDSLTPRTMSLLERLQEKTKKTNKKGDDVVQNIVDGVIKSSQNKSHIRDNPTSEQRSGIPVTDEHLLKNVKGLPVDYKLADRSSAARLLVHGDMRSRPIQSIADANFPPEIHQALGKMDVKSPMRIQMYAWPAIMRGQYTVLVGPRRSGKTMSYIVPIVSFMLTPDIHSELPPGNGPLVLVLCSGSRSAEFVYEKCCSLLRSVTYSNIRVQLALGERCQIDLRDKLANGCDILVSTPRCVMRLLCCSHLITNLDRLAHLVVDEVDILAEKFLPEVKKILGECKNKLKQRRNVAVPIQLIAVSEKWCPAVEQFSQHVSQDFVICISGHLESAIYAKLQPILHFLSAKHKLETLLDILDGERGLYKTLVVCKNAEEVDMLEPFLVSQCFNVITAHEDKTLNHNRETYQRWKNCVSGSYPVLLCSDDVLCELDTHDAKWLIHYSLPPTKTKFGFRFSCLMDNYSNMFHKNSANDDEPDCTVHIFLDKDSDCKALPEVINLMKRLNIPIGPGLEERVKEYTKQQEAQKSTAPLCYNIKAFGECLDKTSCPNRHVVLSALDEPVNLPRCGNVKLKILHVMDASRFAARLLQYQDENGSTVQMSEDYVITNIAVYKHYSNERNRMQHGVPKLGDICGLENKINIFQRVQVVEILREDGKNVPEEVRVYFLDEGIYKEVKVYQLLSLPPHLQQMATQTVEVFLCNVMPCDLDTNWSQEATYRMSLWISNISAGETEGKFVAGKIVLSLGNTLWLDPLKCCRHLESMDTFVTEVSLRTQLLKTRLAVENKSHIENLLEMCRQAHVHVPACSSAVEKQPVQSKEVLPTPQWAHLPCDGYQAVTFICATNPHEFFVQRTDLDKCFQELVSEIQEYVKMRPEDFDVEKGSFCIGKCPEDGMWYRAQINEIEEDKHVSLFFVDHGDFASVSMDDIAPITHKLITKLPFQAIECSMADVRPVDGDIWCDSAVDVLYEIADCSNLYVKVCEVMKQGRCTGGKKYEVLCVDASTDIVLNHVLVERNLAVSDNTVQFKGREDFKQDESSDISDESDIEIDNCVVKLSDVCKEVKPCDLKSDDVQLGECSEDEYDVVMDDLEIFVKRMFGLDKLARSICPPHDGNISLPALPAPDSGLHSASSVGSPSSGRLSDEECIPPLASHIKTPDVLWYQDLATIDMKIKLTGVVQYYLEWDYNHFKFNTELNNDIYEVEGELFGPISPSEFWHSAKGLHVHIKMKKAVCGYMWPRMFNSRSKKMWLKYDLDMLKEDSGISLQAADNGNLPGLKPGEKEEAVIVADTDDEDDSCDCDDEYDLYEVTDIPYDPHDPLN